jgi:ribonuclease Z
VLTTVKAADVTVRGVSVGGVYTSLHVPELDLAFDVGIAPRAAAGVSRLFLSHGHVDHTGALASLVGIRALFGKPGPLTVYLPAEIEAPIQDAMAAMARMQRWPLAITTVPLSPGDARELGGGLWVRAFRTFHPVPSLGYQLYRRISKLKPEHRGMAGEEIRRRKAAGEPLFEVVERLELAYATDTLIQVLEHEPTLFDSRVLILECTFLDARKSLADSRAGCHIHLDELVPLADRFRNEALVLMHFSQLYRPREVGEILRRRLPAGLMKRVVPFAPDRDHWP